MARIRYNGPETYVCYEGASGLRYSFTGPNMEAKVENENDIKMFREKGGFTVLDGIELGNLPKAKRTAQKEMV